ncbi:M23 family metallopeptidase [Streptomyces sp. NBC_00576]|uniref:M23 family metallopeptidase n=1 Tax=Streptomyces sp. NBC_00576 TaxID=2903665 RepID=UPI002E80D10F|nr:M23 family metallopeptidase [Streptomyces sp. NBC_00576]WUB74477.1 peptidoglycan DD-metalloendopeptidase family protein [Streptomyces sp. NBC_00576]
MRVLKRTKSIGMLVATVAAAGLIPLAAGQADAAPAKAAETGSCPTAGTVTQGWSSGHDGVDIANSRGTAIYATGSGTVIASGPASGYGQWIRIRHDDGSITEYGHMYERLVSVNQRVSGGQHIARMGSEGDSSGNHLHLRTYASASASRGMNPVDYLSARGVSLPCTPGGGGGTPTPGTNFTTWGTSVRVRADARLNAAVVRTLTGPTAVFVECQKHGDTVNAEGYTNDAWSYIPALGGYITNIYIDNPAAWLPGVREC